MEEKKNSNIVVVQDTEEKKTRYLTWSSWIKGIKVHKWWVIGATVLTGFVGFASIQWVINPMREALSVSYKYKLATQTDTDKTERFINGEVFDYSNIVSLETLTQVKESNEEFAKLDIEKIFNSGAIKVVRNINADYENEITYTLSSSAKVFSDKDLGRKFMAALIRYPLAQSTKAIENYKVTSYIDSEFSALSYLDKSLTLNKQYVAISNTYNELKGKFGGNTATDAEGKTLTQSISDFESKSSGISTLIDAFYTNGYVDYEEGKESARDAEIEQMAEQFINSFEAKKVEKENKLVLLNSMQNATIVSTLTNESEYVRAMISLKDEIESISAEMNSLTRSLHWAGYFENAEGKFIYDSTAELSARYHLNHIDADWIEANTAFNTRILASAETLKSQVDIATKVFHYVYNANNSITVLNSGYVDVTGSLPWVIGLVGGLVLGFVVSSLITAEVEGHKSEKKEEK